MHSGYGPRFLRCNQGSQLMTHKISLVERIIILEVSGSCIDEFTTLQRLY